MKIRPSYTREQVLDLSMEDVKAAHLRAAKARETRAGVSTIDWHLVRIDGNVTLAMAKTELLHKLDELERHNG